MKASSDRFEPPPWAAFLLRRLRGLALTLVVLGIAFVLLELLATHFLPGRSTRFLVDGQSNGQPAWIDNQFFPYRFFSQRLAQPAPPIAALKTPPPGTLRICLLGGSETMGFPDPSFGLGRQLELMLQSRYPGHPVEVVTMALEDGNSHVLREVARDLRPLQPHAVIVLVGNDEVAGPYGPAAGLGRLHRSTRITRIMTVFSRTRLSQLFMAGINRLAPGRVDQDAWRSQEPLTLKGRIASDDPRLRTVYRAFRRNLQAILRLAGEASPVTILCTVPVNLRDCPPFSTRFLEDETAAQQVREGMRAAIAAETATNRVEAARLYADVIRRHPTHAEALYRAARLALQDQRTAEAAALYSRARDADALRLRADGKLNDIIRESAAAPSVSLLDAAALFAIRSPQGVPGGEWFLDHIHFTFEGNHLLASALIDRLEFLRAFEPEPAGSIPGRDVLADDLLFDPWGRAAQTAAIGAQMLRPPFRRQLDNAATLIRLNEETRQWNERMAAIPPETAREIFARRQASRPDDAWLAARAAWYLVNAGDPGRAEESAVAATRRWPHRFDMRGLLALIHAMQGRDPTAEIAFLRGEPGADSGYYDIEVALQIGRKFLHMQRYADARPWLEHALGRDPWNSEVAIALAETLYRLEESEPAIALLQAAIQRNPRNPLLWDEIASLYCLVGNWKIATECFRKSEEIAPNRYERLLKWAEALYSLKQYRRAQRRINDYLTAMPNDPAGLALQAQILANLPPQPHPAAETAEDKPSRRLPWE